ncbi:MAG: rhodanese-like domain-containing protein [Alphaproteobacteria bacterium]|nr:rhodanese-like domain-containing protein [Alphaproteobacteria bacterium]
MPQNITRSVEELVAEASKEIRTLSVEEAMDLHGREDVLFVDLRDVRELAKTGRIPGARHVPRGLLEFWIDPKSPYHKPFFAADRTFVFYCAVSWRSALATKAAQEMGLAPVAHLEGGFEAWTEAGGPVQAPKAKREG